MIPVSWEGVRFPKEGSAVLLEAPDHSAGSSCRSQTCALSIFRMRRGWEQKRDVSPQSPSTVPWEKADNLLIK